MKIKIYEVEEKETSAGKAYKNAVVQVEGAQYPDKNVKVWSNFPDYDKVVAGAQIEAEIEKKDSSTPNPHQPGKFYQNKALVVAGSTTTPQTGGDSRIYNYLNLKIEPMLKEILERQRGTWEEDDYPRPANEGGDEINPEDVPF
jgi:hypothetical protein